MTTRAAQSELYASRREMIAGIEETPDEYKARIRRELGEAWRDGVAKWQAENSQGVQVQRIGTTAPNVAQ